MIELSDVLNTLESVSVVLASLVAVRGINSWRTEAEWKRKYELAEEVLASFYEAHDAISKVRSPLSFGGEGKTRIRDQYESSEESEILDQSHIVFERIEKFNDLFFRLRAVRYRFKAVFGKDSDSPFDEMDELIHKIKTAAYLLGTKYWKEQGRRHFEKSEFERHLEDMHKYESYIWRSYSEYDEIEERLLSTIKKVENIAQFKQNRLPKTWWIG